MTAPDPLILVGRVAGAQGLKGELRLTAYTADPLAVAGYGVLRREDGSPALTLTTVRAVKDATVVARAREVADRTAAEALKGVRLYVRRSALPAPEEDEVYVADLIGCAAVTAEGERLGEVRAVQDFGAGDLLEIDPGEGRPTWYLPFTRAAVPAIDLPARRLTAVRPPEVEGDPDHGAREQG